MKEWTLYILECKDGSYYTGITTDLEKRLIRHNQGRATRYTMTRKPVKLVYTESLGSESVARRRETEIKDLSHYNKKRLIKSG